mgnify:CR=1 FL=1
MDIQAVSRNIHMSAKKMLPVTHNLQGMKAEDARKALALVARKSARCVLKTLNSAIANAENNNNLKLENLRVKAAMVGQAKPWKRWMTRARGGADTILKRNCHIRIVLTDS